jgi:2OG-Fe(II) oxygenase superfamily
MSQINLIDDLDGLEWEEIYPGVIVYKNMLKDPNKAYQVMMQSEESSDGKYFLNKWDPWAHFGTYTQPKDEHTLQSAEAGIIFDDEKSLNEEIRISYDKAISHYVNHTGTKLPEDARYSGHSYCKYFNKIDTLKNNMTMQYHTDYIISERDMPGEKFFITCTFYINDNYDGGDIEFYVNGDITNHKPSAGDLVVFPSGEPFYHGVKTIPSGNKFFVRNFVMHTYNGSEEWLENQRKFGAHRWSKKEIERVEEENKRNMLYLKNGSIIDYDEVQKNLNQTEYGMN